MESSRSTSPCSSRDTIDSNSLSAASKVRVSMTAGSAADIADIYVPDFWISTRTWAAAEDESGWRSYPCSSADTTRPSQRVAAISHTRSVSQGNAPDWRAIEASGAY